MEGDVGSDAAAGPGVGSGSGREVLGTDPGSGDSGAVCVGLEPPQWCRGAGGLPGTGGACGAVGHSMCPLCSPGMESQSGPGWRHLGSPPRTRSSGASSSAPLVAPAAPSAPPEARPPSSTPPPLCFSPASLDAFVFSYLALLLQTKLPSGKLQAHLRGLHNLCAYCTHILSLYFPWDGGKGHPDGGRAGPRAPAPRPPSFLAPQLRRRLHARLQRAQRRRRSRTGAGTRSCPCWRGWRPWWATPCSAASSLSSGQRLPGHLAHGAWAWPRRTKTSDCPHVPRTAFSTVMHSRGPRVSPSLVWPELGCSPTINLLTRLRSDILSVEGPPFFLVGARGRLGA